jgi:Skp family chaperone for outer membrane proteins
MFLAKLKTTVSVAVLATVMGLGVGSWACRPAAADAPDPQGEDPIKPAAETRAPRVALLNLTYVLKHYDEYKALQDAVKKEMADYQTRDKVFRDKLEDLRKVIADSNLPAGKREELEREMRAEQRKAEDLHAEAKQKMSKTTDEQTVMLYKKVQKAAARYAEAHNIDLVLHYNDAATGEEQDSPQNVTRKMQTGACVPLYWKAELDISKAVVGAMNESYRAPAKGK